MFQLFNVETGNWYFNVLERHFIYFSETAIRNEPSTVGEHLYKYFIVFSIQQYKGPRTGEQIDSEPEK